nr:hypothetical protein GCM10020241_58110 [Streptoalloteichus tenebrarius]
MPPRPPQTNTTSTEPVNTAVAANPAGRLVLGTSADAQREEEIRREEDVVPSPAEVVRQRVWRQP